MKRIISSYNPKNNKEPELIIDGQKIKFYSNRQERLALKINQKNNDKKNKNKQTVILFLNIIMIAIAFMFVPYFTKSLVTITDQGFKFYFSKLPNDKNVDFSIEIKNITQNENTLSDENRNMELNIYENKNKKIFSKSLYISKKTFTALESYKEIILTEKFSRGKYSAELKFGLNNDKRIKFNFFIK